MRRMMRQFALAFGWTGAVLGYVEHSPAAAFAALCAGMASLAAGWSWLAKARRERLEAWRVAQDICNHCRGYAGGEDCPLPPELRPEDCPQLLKHRNHHQTTKL